MPVRRKIFRIEEMMRAGVIPPAGNTGRHADRAATLSSSTHDSPDEIARICAELAAVVIETERSTQRILAAAEEIDQAAKILSASVKNDHEHGLTGDIQDNIIRVVEACNFQDLSGQRVSKVLSALSAITERFADGALAPANLRPPKVAASKLVNGPKLDGAPGHVTQADIDLMFKAGRRR